jgi:putative membrane-bound dehydrogenase-like protein
VTRPITIIFAALSFNAIAAGQGHAPNVAASKMTLPEGFKVKLVVAEPTVRQPVAIDFDERGRLWVMQYLQYPNPAGLKRTKVDRYSRTVYDRIPEPPPRGPKGADRLTILEPDPKRPGEFKPRDFVSGLNLASGFAFGHGGVFVLQTPYLLFYPDRNRDDVPDGDPDVLLTGFGMEDAHSVANSLTWGLDGWLYGCQGSTVTANIGGNEFQQGVWRYHPISRKFELFCEGGGNSWGLDFDRHGNLLYSTNHGGFTMLHGVQGGYYWKSFGKHGALHNPHAYGYFDHVPHENFRGGHVTVGGIIYRGDQFPSQFRDRYIGADLLGHAVRWHEIVPNGSSFRSKNGGELLVANDTWFAPSDVCLGPDGCVYVADWHDSRTAHPDPDAEWDRSNGRVFRISYGEPKTASKLDLASETSVDLVKLLAHPNDWHARTARRILADRRDPELILPLRTRIRAAADDSVLELLWTLCVSGGLTESFGRELLDHRNEHVRRWAVRLMGDEGRVETETARQLEQLAKRDASAIVCSQLACTARRLKAQQALPILNALSRRDDDLHDPHIPLLIWWGVEQHCISSRDLVVKAFAGEDIWSSKFGGDVILPRLVRRYSADGTATSDDACALLLRYSLCSSVEQGVRERPAGAKASKALIAKVREFAEKAPSDPILSGLLARFGDQAARDRLLDCVQDSKQPLEKRLRSMEVLSEIAPSSWSGSLLKFIKSDEPESLRAAALAAWSRLGKNEEAEQLIVAYRELPAALRGRVRSSLLSRKGWAISVLKAVDSGRVPVKDFSPEELFAATAHRESDIDALVRKHWGNIRSATPEEKLADVRRFNNDLRAAGGDKAAGKILFTKHCAACHKLHGEGGMIGPDLTHANRSNRDYLLISLVDPNSVIRKEYLSYTAETSDNRLVTGIITAQTPATVTVTNAKAEATMLKRDDIVSLRESPVSLMPEGLLTALKPQELRDLFAYLQN